jgi:anti-sigma B factor antagonist
MKAQAMIRQDGPVSIVDLSGQITLTDGFDLVRNTIKQLVNAGHDYILLNLKRVDHIDSAGLGALVSGYATVTNAGGSLKLVSPQARIDSLLRNTGLSTLFITFTDETEAVRSFAVPAGGRLFL